MERNGCFSFSYIHGRCALSCVCVFFCVLFSDWSPPRKRISLVLSLSRGSLPSLLPCAAAAAIVGGGGRCPAYFTCVGVVSPLHKNIVFCLCVSFCHRIRRFIKKNPFFVFLVFFSSCFFFFFFFFTGGEDLLCACVFVCVFVFEREGFVCLFFLVGFVE